MKTQTPDRTGMLILRLWVERKHEKGLRARITQTLDTATTEQPVAVAATPDDICLIVKQWVQTFADANSHNGSLRPG